MQTHDHVFEAMEHLQWRDVLLPLADWSHQFSHESIQHHIIYRAGVAVDMLGSQARTFSYVIPLREGILRSPFRYAFTSIYYRFYEAYRDKTPDTLIDPVHGAITAVPGSWDANTNPDGMDGATVRVSFTEDVPVDGAQTDSPPTFDSLTRNTGSFDEESRRALVDWVRPERLKPTTDPLSLASGILQQGNRLIDKTRAHGYAVAQRANEIEQACEDLDANGVPFTNSTRLAARKVRIDAIRLAESKPLDVPGKVVQITLSAPKSAAQIAREFGMDLADFLKMNPGAARGNTVAPGTRLYVSERKKRRR